MAGEIIEKWSKLSITEEENEIAELGGSNDEEQNNKLALSLVGKLLTIRSYNFEALQNTLKQIWSLSHGVLFRKIENNLFVIQFFHWRDKEKVLDGALWNFDNQLLLLKDIQGDEQLENIDLKFCPFWIRLYNLPFDNRSDEDVKKITEKVGVVLEVEQDELGWDKSRRVRVMIDTSKPIRRIQKIRNKKGVVTSVQFKYERLSTFCFLCGILGHTEKDCPNADEDEEIEEKQWGLWLRASPRKGHDRLKEEVDSLRKKSQSLVFTHKPESL
ncbi:uncharacterized protein LOC110723457 [Chenopodium quinoa]|uniref:uncharacterized protein LOC110723457 n=1 Tax=Chenopodium quinoa TaxID=63459 RepID=UPI000B777F76|nr:uncharacterized protein LOC110723457 [Chenopodium quinoa]